jgi:hypothetical protein
MSETQVKQAAPAVNKATKGKKKKKRPSLVMIVGTSLDSGRVCSCCESPQYPEEEFYAVESGKSNKGHGPDSSTPSICGSCISCAHCKRSFSGGVGGYYDGKCTGCRKRLMAVVSADSKSAGSSFGHIYLCHHCNLEIKGSGHIRTEDAGIPTPQQQQQGQGGGGQQGGSTSSGGGNEVVARRHGLKVIRYYCAQDYEQLFAEKCAGKVCGLPLKNGQPTFEALGKK